MSARAITVAIGLAIVGASPTPIALAQQMSRRDVPAGDVTGLEMSIEGSLEGIPGGELTWLVDRNELLPAFVFQDLAFQQDYWLMYKSFDTGIQPNWHGPVYLDPRDI